jgi:hypothetical protein
MAELQSPLALAGSASTAPGSSGGLNTLANSSASSSPEVTPAGDGADASSNASVDTTYLQNLLKDPAKLRVYGEQAMGRNTPEYLADKAKVDAAEARLLAAHDNRIKAFGINFDPKMLALSAGLLSPGGGGGFFEGLSKGLQGFNAEAAKEAEQKRKEEELQYSVLKARMNDTAATSKFGFEVASKLAPKLTALQQQVQAEGLNPTSPEGVRRLKQLQFIDKATPEQKAFMSENPTLDPTSPDFANALKREGDIKDLKPIALRLSLNLNDPVHEGIARREFNRERVLTQISPDLKKHLESFNGDVTNPTDMAKAARMLAEEQGLDVQSKRANIAQSNAAVAASDAARIRSIQDTVQHAINGDVGAIADKAKQEGVPMPDLNRYMKPGISPIEAEKLRAEDYKNSTAFLKTLPNQQKLSDDVMLLNQAADINKKLPTGSLLPRSKTYRDFLSGNAADYQVLEKLTNRTLSGLRIEGDKNISNADRDFMKASTFSFDNKPEANQVIIDTMKSQAQRDLEYHSFMNKYTSLGGNVADGNERFKRYADANPIMVKDNTGAWVPNPHRMTYSQYFYAPRVQH